MRVHVPPLNTEKSGLSFLATNTSWLFVPGNRPERFVKAERSGAGGIILDLEDAVAPEHRPQAREDVARFLATSSGVAQMVRLSESSGAAVRLDIGATALQCSHLDALLLPKVESPEQILDVKEACVEIFGQEPAIVSLIESAKGVLAAQSIAENSDAIMIGEADLASDLRCVPSSSRLTHAASLVQLASNASGIETIASPWFDIRDEHGLARRAAQDSADGYTAKAAIHPSQIPVIQASFRPDLDTVRWAENVVQAMENGAVSTVGGIMIDEALARRARHILQRISRG